MLNLLTHSKLFTVKCIFSFETFFIYLSSIVLELFPERGLFVYQKREVDGDKRLRSNYHIQAIALDYTYVIKLVLIRCSKIDHKHY